MADVSRRISTIDQTCDCDDTRRIVRFAMEVDWQRSGGIGYWVVCSLSGHAGKRYNKGVISEYFFIE